MNLRISSLSYASLAGLSLFMTGCASPSSTGSARSNESSINQYVEGYHAYHNGDQALAKRTLEAAIQQDPSLIMARNLLGEIYRKESNYPAAVTQYTYLSDVDPYTIDNHYYLGVSYHLWSKYREATLAYLKGLNIDPNDFRCNMNVGTAYLALGDMENARKYLDHATQIDPKSSVAWSNLGVALNQSNSLVLAETAYRKAYEFDSTSITIQQNLGDNLLLQKKTGEAIYMWEQVVTKSNTPYSNIHLAMAYTQGGQFDKAHEKLDSVLAQDPRNLSAINTKAATYVHQYELSGFSKDDYRAKAVDLYRKSLSLNRQQTDVAAAIDKWKNASAIGK